jgi:methionine-rich copper-binding protein CopC
MPTNPLPGTPIATAFRFPLGSGYVRTQKHNEASQFLYDQSPDFEYHLGEDWANGKAGGDVLAAANGKVTYAGWIDGFGNAIVIQHPLADGRVVTTVYGHLSSIAVHSGTVTIGQKIGAVGHTGLGTGDHLHFAVYLGQIPLADIHGISSTSDPDVYNSGWVDPTYFLKNFKPPVLDTTPPDLVSSTPADNASKVAVDANIVLKFNETVTDGSGNIEIWAKGGKKPFETIDVDSSRVTFSGSTVMIDPKGNFAAGTEYYVKFAKGVIEDLAGNDFVGITSSTELNFTTTKPDTTAPKLVGSTPADNATKVATDANIVLRFSESVTDGSGSIEIYTKSGKLFEKIDVDSSRVTFSGSTVTVDPKGKLATGTEYYVKIAKGVIEDDAGNDYAGITSTTALTFSTTSAGKGSSLRSDDLAQPGEDTDQPPSPIQPATTEADIGQILQSALPTLPESILQDAAPFSELTSSAFSEVGGGALLEWAEALPPLYSGWDIP